MEPHGCAVDGWQESIGVQARLAFGSGEALLIQKLMGWLAEHPESKVETQLRAFARSPFARRSALDEDDVRTLYAELRSLQPFPGRPWSGDNARYVRADLRVERKAEPGDDGRACGFDIIMNNSTLPVLRIQPSFEKFSQGKHSKGLSEKDREKIEKQVSEARWFIHSVQWRGETVFRLAAAIVSHQYDFFDKGPRCMAPLTLKSIAKELELDISTISRAARGKYLECEWGIFELRSFFSLSIESPVKKDDTTDKTPAGLSKSAVKTALKELLESKEGAGKTDSALTDMLKQKGISISRRTVAKYRAEMNLGSSYQR
jgi:RNA polymerase sigma-54 factor